jgi:hypothetical protein
MPFMTKEQILGVKDLHIEEVSVPEWDATVGVRVMRGSEYDYFDECIAAAGQGYVKNFRPLVCALTICDEYGGRLFSTTEVEALAEKSEAAIERIYEVACRLNKLRTQDREELEKNASPAQDISSGTKSPDSLADAP